MASILIILNTEQLKPEIKNNILHALDYIPLISTGANLMHLVSKHIFIKSLNENYVSYLESKCLSKIILHALPFGKILEKIAYRIWFVFAKFKFTLVCRFIDYLINIDPSSLEFKRACNNHNSHMDRNFQNKVYLQVLQKVYPSALKVFNPLYEVTEKIHESIFYSRMKLHPRQREFLDQKSLENFPSNTECDKLLDLLLEGGKGWEFKKASVLKANKNLFIEMGILSTTFDHFISELEKFEKQKIKQMKYLSFFSKEAYKECSFKALIADLELELWINLNNPTNAAKTRMKDFSHLLKTYYEKQRAVKIFQLEASIQPVNYLAFQELCNYRSKEILKKEKGQILIKSLLQMRL